MFVSDSGFEDVSEAYQLVGFQQIVKRHFRMLDLEISLHVAILPLCFGNQVNGIVRPCLDFRIPVVRQGISCGFQPFGKAFILENISDMPSFDFPGGNPEIVNDAALLIVIDHTPLIRDDDALDHIRVSGKKGVPDMNTADINGPDIMDCCHLSTPPHETGFYRG